MRINKQFIAAQGAKALPSKPGGCCGTAASKQFVFPTDSGPCCAGIDCIDFFQEFNNPRGSQQESTPYDFSGLNCPVTICFSATTDASGNDQLTLWTYISQNTISEPMPLDNSTVCKTFNNGDSFYFLAESDICNKFFIGINNITCNNDCGTRIILGVNRDNC
jgi:hypothetical protein